MALYESPIMQPPPNSPASLSLQGSLTDNTRSAPIAKMEDDDDIDSDDFEDSVDKQQDMDLNMALAECERAITLFFNNQLDRAIDIMTPWQETSLYHAHGATILEFIPAVLTLEPGQIQRAKDALAQTLTLCAQQRKSYTLVQSIGAIIKTPNYGSYSEVEAHAELVHAEAWLLMACLGIIENEDMTGLLRASLRVKASYSQYGICAKILAKKTWENEQSRAHFESGVRLGLATFNVMIAMLPPRIVAVLQFVGFSADKEQGKMELMKAAQSAGLRSVLCELTLLVYFLVIGHFAAIPPDFDAAEKIISKSLKKYPDSIWFLMFKARLQLLRGQTLGAIGTYQKTCRMQDLWPQIKHLAYWELVWAFAMLRQWTNAAEYAALLEQESKWSRTIYMYTQAAMLIQTEPETPDERNAVDALLRNAANYRQRLLGRSLPMEKFVVQRCERWIKRGYLILPGIELLCLWNIFPALAAEGGQADSMLKIIERTTFKIRKSIEMRETRNRTAVQEGTEPEYDEDDLALAEFLRGSLLTAMALPRLGLQHLELVLRLKDKIQENKLLVPYALVEIASCHYQFGDPILAVTLLQKARKKFSGYQLEARLHFRIHSKLEYISAGISDVPKRVTEGLTVTGAEIIEARRAKPQASTNKTIKPSTISNAFSKANAQQMANNQRQEPSVSYEPVAGPSSAPDPVFPVTVTRPSESPIPGPSSAPDPVFPVTVTRPSEIPIPGPSSARNPVYTVTVTESPIPGSITSPDAVITVTVTWPTESPIPGPSTTTVTPMSTTSITDTRQSDEITSSSDSSAKKQPCLISDDIEMDLISPADPEPSHVDVLPAVTSDVIKVPKKKS